MAKSIPQSRKAFEECGGRALYPAVRVADEPLELPLRRGVWAPRNADGKFAGKGEPYDIITGLRYADRIELRHGTWRIAQRQGIVD